MILTSIINQLTYQFDLNKPLDISIPLRHGKENPKCYGVDDPDFYPVRAGDFIGALESGSPVNFYNLRINPHGNGTHTECLGHIFRGDTSIHSQLQHFHFPAQLISVKPNKSGNDLVIDADCFNLSSILPGIKALVLRTLPNTIDKLTQDYSGTNPAFLDVQLAEQFVLLGIEHLLLDLPSVDKEIDGGKLAAHHAFWGNGSRTNCTITELIYVEDSIADGIYLLNLQAPNLVLDAAPSRPVLYPLLQTTPA